MISPIHPNLQGIAAERFFALGQELMRRQRSNQCDRLTDLSEREASWADHHAGMNGDRERYKACARVLVDLAKARWTVAEDRFGIELQSPDARPHHALSQLEIEQGKRRVRTELQPLLDQQFLSASVRKFISQMEQPSKSSKAKSIGFLIADGREVAQRLEQARRAKTTIKRVEALQDAVRPYLQLVVPGERDEFTNLPLGDVWRYFRYSWCIPQQPIPGRQMLYLIRDAAHPYHAVMGIASLNNCAMQNKVRDDRIGWTGEAFLSRAREVALSGGQGVGKELKAMLSYLNTQLDIAILHIETKGLCTTRDLEQPTPQLIDSLRRRSGQFAEIRRDALEVISKNRDVPDIVQDYESNHADQLPVSDEVLALEDLPLTDRAMTHARRMLVSKKRAAELARLLDAKLTLLSNAAAFVDPKSLPVCAAREEMMTAVHTALLSVKSERVGTNMLELTTCGAVPPYNPILAGKLVALLMLSPQVAADYQSRYGKEASIISSQLKNERRQKDSTLVYLGTTSLFSEGSSQYERLKVPAGTIAPDQTELRYESLGNTTGYGTVQFSPETVRSVEKLLESEYGYQEVNSVFGEGFSPRLRKLRAGLQLLGFEAEHLLVHHQQRRVFGVKMFPGTADFLMGKKTPLPSYLRHPRRYLDASQQIVDYWTTRWLSMRLDHAPALDALQSVTGWKLSDHLPVSEGTPGDQSSSPPTPPRHKPISADVSKVVDFWRSLAFGGPEVCSDVLADDDLEALHVAQDLDQFLVDRVRKGYSVILTGNAGDGKTHLLRRLEPELQRLNAVVQYDASAAMDHTKIAPILNEWRKARRSSRPYCLAANEYPLYLLREHGRRKPEDLPVLAEVDRQCRLRLSYGIATLAEKAKAEHGKVLVVDLSLRNPLHSDFAGAMLDRLLKNPALSTYAKSNVELNFSESFRRLSQETVRKRLLGLFDQLRALGHRATVRELWIVLARLFFGGKPGWLTPVAGRFADWYSERLFDSDNHLSLVENLRRWVDPASVSHPRWDLSLEAVEGTRAEDWLVDRAVPTLDRRRMAYRDGRAIFDAIKRRFYFEHSAGEEAFVLQGGFANEFRELLQQSVGHRMQVAEQIVEAINLCYCPAASVEHRSKLYLWVGHRYHEQPSRAFVAQAFFHTTDFEILLPRMPKRLEGSFAYRPDHFILQLRGGDRYRLIVDFRLFETLRRVQKGLPRHLLPERDLNRLDSFLTQLHEAQPQRTSEFLIYNQETLTTSRIQISEDHTQYMRVTRAV
jgi:Druantia protein DruA